VSAPRSTHLAAIHLSSTKWHVFITSPKNYVPTSVEMVHVYRLNLPLGMLHAEIGLTGWGWMGFPKMGIPLNHPFFWGIFMGFPL
jgi:hypothetical protein